MARSVASAIAQLQREARANSTRKKGSSMNYKILVPIAGVGLVAGSAAVLGLDKFTGIFSGKKAPPAPPIVPSPPTVIPQSPAVQPAPPQVAAQLPQLTQNPDGTPHIPGTPITFPTTAEAIEAVKQANAQGISIEEFILKSTGQLPANGSTSTAVAGKRGVVTTNDPAPAGDLIIRTAPNPTAPQIAGGGADKGGIVTVIRDVDATWCEVIWPGGRRPAGRGFARKQYIKLV